MTGYALDLSFHLFDVVIAALQAGTLLVLYLTLEKVKEYTEATQGLREASVNQTEASVKQTEASTKQTEAVLRQTQSLERPFVILDTVRRPPPLSATLNQLQDLQPLLPEDPIRLVNVGTGPAVNVDVTFKNTTNQGVQTVADRCVFPVIAPGAFVATRCNRRQLTQNPHVEVSYESVRKRGYSTVQHIQLENENRSIAHTEFIETP
jgi:hypothetical protein